jgi:nucleotide-binding universal stress UspA family protein
MTKTTIEAPLTVSGTPEGGTSWPSEVLVREILFPSDLSAPSDRAFEHARLLAEGLDARLVLYHAIERELTGGEEEDEGVALEIERRVAATAREHLEFLLDGVRATWETFVETGDSAPQALLRFLRSRPPDLTVMATHGRGGLSHLLLGSVTEGLLHERPGPVLCVREPEHGTALPYRRVLVPTDFSEASRAALPWAGLLARTFDCEVLVAHFAECPAPRSLSGVPDLVEQAFPSESRVLEFALPQLEGRRVTGRVHEGRTWEGLIDVARWEKPDVLVISPSSEERAGRHVFGGHLDNLVRHAPCPVLVV